MRKSCHKKRKFSHSCDSNCRC